LGFDIGSKESKADRSGFGCCCASIGMAGVGDVDDDADANAFQPEEFPKVEVVNPDDIM